MAEVINPEEKQEIKFNRYDLTPFEHLMIGSSVDVMINGNKICINNREFKRLQRDKEALKIILTPISLTEGKRTLEEVRQVRMHGEVFSGLLIPFEIESQLEYMERKTYLTFEPGKLDDNGQLEAFGVYLSQNKQKIKLPEKVQEEVVVGNGFRDLIRYAGNTDEIMQYKINAGKMD